MFRSDLVIGALVTRVGWQQPTSSDYAILTGDNLVSLSGMYFTDYHKAVTVKNLKETIGDADISDPDFNAELLRMQKSAINRVLQGVFNHDQIIENLQLYSRWDTLSFQELTGTDKFCGFRISVANDSSKTVILNSISLLFNGVETFNMYCYHTVKGKIWEKSVTTVAGIETVVNVTDLFLSMTDATHKGGDFFIGYFQNDIVGKAIEYESPQYNQANIFGYWGFEADRTGVETYENTSVVETNNNYGLNLEFTSVNDYTTIINRNAAQFDEAVGLQFAIDAVEQMINSTRSNMTERLNKEQLAQLYNDINLQTATENMPYTGGLKNRLQRELNRLNQNFFSKGKVTIC